MNKLIALRGYLWSYSVLMAKNFPGKFAYVDGMSGAGFLQVGSFDAQQQTLTGPPKREIVLGSAMLGLSNHPHYPLVFLVEKNRTVFQSLKARVDAYYPGRAQVDHGDCNDLLPLIAKRLLGKKALFFLDPEGLELDFATIRSIKRECPSAEVFVLYPYHMAVRRCLNHEESEERLTRFFGTDRWKALRDECKASDATKEHTEQRFLEFYMQQLNDAGFKHVLPLDVVRSDTGRDLYFLILAGDNVTGQRIMKDIDERVRGLLND